MGAKAWVAYDKEAWEDWQTVVFADTASKARSVATRTAALSESRWVDIRVNRCKVLDHLYKGQPEMDTDDPDAWLYLVKEMEWACLDTSDFCDSCNAKPWCRHFTDDDGPEGIIQP